MMLFGDYKPSQIILWNLNQIFWAIFDLVLYMLKIVLLRRTNQRLMRENRFLQHANHSIFDNCDPFLRIMRWTHLIYVRTIQTSP